MFTYLPYKLHRFVIRVAEARGKSVSSTIMAMILNHQKIHSPKISQFLKSEASKRGYEEDELMDVVIDILRDVARGVIS